MNYGFYTYSSHFRITISSIHRFYNQSFSIIWKSYSYNQHSKSYTQTSTELTEQPSQNHNHTNHPITVPLTHTDTTPTHIKRTHTKQIPHTRNVSNVHKVSRIYDPVAARMRDKIWIKFVNGLLIAIMYDAVSTNSKIAGALWRSRNITRSNLSFVFRFFARPFSVLSSGRGSLQFDRFWRVRSSFRCIFMVIHRDLSKKLCRQNGTWKSKFCVRKFRKIQHNTLFFNDLGFKNLFLRFTNIF